MKKHILFPMVAGALFAGQLAFGDRMPVVDSYGTNRVVIHTAMADNMTLTQRDVDPAMFGTIADLWDLEVSNDENGEAVKSTFVTAFRQRDLLILKEVNGDKKVTIDFAAEHAYVDIGSNEVETYSDIELIDTSVPIDFQSS